MGIIGGSTKTYMKLIALVLMFMMICPATMPTLASISTDTYLGIPNELEGGTVTDRAVGRVLNNSYRYVYVFIPVSRVRELVGVRVDRVFAALCNDVLAFVKLIPRRFTRTHFVTLNKTVLIPDIGSETLSEEDILVIHLPIPVGAALVIRNSSNSIARDFASLCPWSRVAAKYSIRDRVLVRFSPLTPALGDSGFTRIGQSLTIAIYFSKNASTVPPFVHLPYDVDAVDALDAVGNALNLKKPEVKGPIDVNQEEQMNAWLARVRERVLALGIERTIDTLMEHREGFIYDFELDQLISEVVDKNKLDVLHQTQVSRPIAYLNGGGGPSRFYEFVVILRNNTVVRSSHSIAPIYLGYNIYSVGIYVRARSSSSTQSNLAVDVRITDYSSGSIVSSSTYSYQLSSNPSDIFITPSIPYTNSRAFRISITFRYTGGAHPIIVLSTLVVRKIWEQMPTPQTAKGYQLVSAGIASIRLPEYNYLPPPGCSRARASDMLDKSAYGRIPGPTGIIFYSSIRSVSVDTVVMNGLYYDDSTTSSSPLLHIDICVFNPYSGSVSGTINVKLNGVTYLSRQLSVAPLSYGYVGSTTLMGSNPIYGAGPIITIESTFLGDVRVYVDILIEYQYAPEVWRPNNDLRWSLLHRLPWVKLSVNQITVDAMLWRSGITLNAFAVNKVEPAQYDIYGAHMVSVANAHRVLSAGIYFSGPIRHRHCSLVYEGTNTREEKMIGIVATVWGLVSLGIDIAKLVGVSVPNILSVGVFIANTVFAILQSSSSSINEVVTSDGFRGCSWSAGVLQNFKWVEIGAELSINIVEYLSNPQINIRFEANDNWRSRNITVRIPIHDNRTYIDELAMFYGRTDIFYN